MRHSMEVRSEAARYFDLGVRSTIGRMSPVEFRKAGLTL